MAVNSYDDTLDQAEQQESGATPNPYDETLRLQDQTRETGLRRSAIQSQATTPDRAAESRRLSQQLGVPTSVIERNFDRFKTQSAADALARIGRDSPQLGDWLAADPNNAAVAHDDLQPLGAMERALSVGRRMVADPALSLLKGAISLPEAGIGLLDIATLGHVGRAAESVGYQPELAKSILSTFYSKGQGESFQSVSEAHGLVATAVAALTHPSVIAHSVLESAPLMLAGGIAGRALPFLSPVIAGAVGEGAAQAGSAAEQTRATSEAGTLTPKQAALAASSGVVTSALSVFGGKLAEHLGIADVDTMLAGAAVSPPARRGLATQIVYGAIEEGFLEELPQSVQEQVHQNAAEGRPLMDGVDNAAVMGALAGAAMGGGGQVFAHRQQQVFEQIGKAAKESKTLQRSPEAAQAFIEHATKDSAISHVYAPPDTFAEYAQSKGIDPRAWATELTGDAQAYDTAISTGQDLAIPMAAYATKLAGTEHNTFFQNELRLHPNEENAREAEAREAETVAQLAEPAGEPAPASAVRTAVQSQLEAAGYPRATAEQQAALYESTFGTLAQRAGVDPMALFQRYGLKIERAGLEAGGAAATTTEAPAAAAAPAEATVPASGERRERPVSGQPTGLEHLSDEDLEARADSGDAAQAKPVRAEMLRRRYTDDLTGLPNRAAFNRAQAAAEADPNMHLAVFDINNFKALNDTHGHPTGDRALVDIGQKIKQAATEFGYGERVFRTGGDEYIVIAAADKIEQIRDRAEQLVGVVGMASGTRTGKAAVPVSLTGTTGPTYEAADAPLEARKDARNAELVQEARQRAPDYAPSRIDMPPATGDTVVDGQDTGAAAAAADQIQAGTRPADDQGQRARVDQGGLGENQGDQHGADLERLHPGAPGQRTADLPGLDEVFDRRPLEENAARFTPAVVRELVRMADEMSEFPFRKHIFLEAGPGRGGDLDVIPGGAGATVYDDVLAFSPLNLNAKTGKPAKRARGDRSKVATAIQAALAQQDIPNNLIEGAVRVAENRAAENYRFLAAPELPHKDGFVKPREFVEQLQREVDAALEQAQPSETAEPDGTVDTSFRPDEFQQGPKPAPADLLPTGETQPRLPGDVGAVRETDVATPQLEAPFALTPEAVTRTAKQTTLFQSPIGQFFQAFFHGSPHDFERFDASRIGTGEGNQAFGHGLYFAQAKDVAEHYRELFTRAGEKGRLYQVDIPDEHVAQMLDWDAPLTEQSEAIQRQLIPIVQWMIDNEYTTLKDISRATGEDAYGALREQATDRLRSQGIEPSVPQEQAEASTALQAMGIPGLKYFDEASRVTPQERDLWTDVAADAKRQGDTRKLHEAERRLAALDQRMAAGTRNVVVFDDSIIELTHKDGTPVSAQERAQYLQGKGDEARGAIAFGPDQQTTITLLEKADLSTFLHESGHFFVEVMADLASQPGASTQIQADMQTLLTAAGHEGDLASWRALDADGRRGVHEHLARSFEAYLMEGKAPSAELRPVFARVRAWMLSVYRSLRSLNVTLTQDVRNVFDRMLATDAAIADAQQQGNQRPLWLTPELAGMPAEQFAKYQDRIAKAGDTARAALEQQLLAEVRREQTAQWKAERSAIEETVTSEVHGQAVYQALAAMQKGTHPDGTPLVEGEEPRPVKLDRQAIVDQFGEDRLKTLPRPYVYAREGGVHPDLMAETYGFSSGDELLTAISQAPKMTDVITQETDRRMLAEHGSLLLDGTLPEKAQAATANDAHEDVIKAELEQLAKIRKGGPARIRAALPRADRVRTFAKERIAGTRVSEVRPQVFWAAARRASTQAIELAAKSDIDGTIVAKQQELVNIALYKEAMRVQADVEARVQRARDLGKGSARERLGRAGESYLDQVDGILDRYEFARVSQKALERRASLRKWAAALEGEGLPVDFPEELLDEARRVNYRELTVEQLLGITDSLDHIAHLARLKNRLLKAADQRDFAAARDGVVASIVEHNERQTLPIEFRPADDKWRKVSAWFASHAKISMLARALDGHVDGGAMWEAFIRPINAAADAEVTRQTETGTAYHAILEQHYPGRELARLNDNQFIPAINTSLSKEGRLAVALNMGNQTSRERILSDPTLRWNEAQLQAVLDTLDERDWNFVQDTWDFLDRFWPEIEAKQRRVTGTAPEKVAAIPVRTKFGELRGGYYPLAYDGRKTPRAKGFEPASEAKLVASAAYVRSTTRRGHVEARQQNVQLSVRLDLGVAFQHLDQVIHDLTHHEMLIDTTRLLRDRQIAGALYESKALAAKGDLLYQQFSSALQDIALGSSAGAGKTSVIDTMATFIRQRTQVAGMAWNLWTALQQPLGLFNGMSRVGPQWVAKGMKRWLRDAASMENTASWIADVSPMMRERVQTATQDLHDVRTALRQPGGWFDTLVRTVSGDRLTQQTILDGYLWHIGIAQRVADIPTWLGAYEKHMAGGENEARAIALADQAVLDSQGGGQIKDLAQVQRGSPVARLFMTFYSYGNTVYNATAERAAATSFKSPSQVLTLLGHLTLLGIMPAVLTEALRCATGRGQCRDWPDYFQNVAGQYLGDAMNSMVVLRELGSVAKIATGLDPGTRGYEGPAGLRPVQLAYQLAQQIHQGQADEAFFKALNQVSGLAFKYPAAQVQRTVDGFIALQHGKTHNPLALLFGPPPKKAGSR